MRREVRWLCLWLAMAGCEAPPIAVAPADATPDGDELGRLLEEVARQECAGLARCGPSEFAALYGDDATCRARTLLGLTRLTGHGITVTLEERKRCVAADEGATCEQRMRGFFMSERPAACDYRGSLPDGARCALGMQCQSGACNGPCGKCVRRVGVAAPCPPGTLCERGLLCHAGFCALPRKLNDACSATEPCSVELSCVASRCVRAPLENEPCADDPERPCALGRNLICEPTTKRCTRLPLARLGETCGLRSDGHLTLCVHGLSCATPLPDKLGQCVPTLPDGAACGGPFSYGGACAAPSWCLDQRCRPLELTDCSLPAPPP